MNIRSLSVRLARIEAQWDNRPFQAGRDAACRQLGWDPIDVGDARCIEDLLMALERETELHATTQADHPRVADQPPRGTH